MLVCLVVGRPDVGVLVVERKEHKGAARRTGGAALKEETWGLTPA